MSGIKITTKTNTNIILVVYKDDFTINNIKTNHFIHNIEKIGVDTIDNIRHIKSRNRNKNIICKIHNSLYEKGNREIINSLLNISDTACRIHAYSDDRIALTKIFK